MHELNWGIHVILYLFLAGLGAGAVVVSGSVLLRKGGFGSSRFAVAKCGALIGPIPAMVGTFLLVFELGQPFRALNLFKVINLSPMSVGSWFLALFIIFSLLYAATFLPSSAGPGDRLARIRRTLAWICVPSGVGVAIYTGILLGAMPARPFWNSPILAGLFLLSAVSSGVAAILLMGVFFRRKSTDPAVRDDYHNSSYLLTATDAIILGGELVIIFLFLLFAQLTIGDVRYAVAEILPGGQLFLPFWVLVIGFGVFIPFVIEINEIRPRLLHGGVFRSRLAIEVLVPILILVGGFTLRYVIVVAGQISASAAL